RRPVRGPAATGVEPADRRYRARRPRPGAGERRAARPAGPAPAAGPGHAAARLAPHPLRGGRRVRPRPDPGHRLRGRRRRRPGPGGPPLAGGLRGGARADRRAGRPAGRRGRRRGAAGTRHPGRPRRPRPRGLRGRRRPAGVVTGGNGAPWPSGGERSRYDGSTVLLVVCCALLLALTLTASVGPGSGQGPADGADDGMDLLRQAAKASQEVSYEGVQAVSSTGPAGTEHRVVEVEHSADSGTRFHEPDGAGEVQVRTADSSEWPDPGARALDTLEHNYRVVRAGTGEVSGRPAALVEAVRADGTTAGRFWIDDETGLPLRRMTLDPL